MAPKRLTLPSGVSPFTLVNEQTVADRQDFSTFRRWCSPQQFLETLRTGGQAERLRLQHFVNPDFRVQEARLFDLLYPARSETLHASGRRTFQARTVFATLATSTPTDSAL